MRGGEEAKEGSPCWSTPSLSAEVVYAHAHVLWGTRGIGLLVLREDEGPRESQAAQVFDADLGRLGFGVDPASCAQNKQAYAACTPQDVAWAYTTSADQEAPYSNTASFLSLLTPSHNAYTTAMGGGYTPTFGGTSAASPYAAGTAAVLQSAATALLGSPFSPANVGSILASSGDHLTNVKVDYGKRRANLGNAVASLTANGAPAAMPVIGLPVLFLTVTALSAFTAIRIRKHYDRSVSTRMRREDIPTRQSCMYSFQ